MFWLMAVALAGPVDRIEKAADKGDYEKAIEAGEEWLLKNPEDPEREAVEDALARAWFASAEEADTVEAYGAFRRRFPDHSLAGRALQREAGLVWPGVEDSGDVGAVEAFIAEYEGTIEALNARAVAEQWSFEGASTDEELVAVLEAWPDSERAPEARERLVTLRVQAARSPEDLVRVLTAFPESAQAPSVAARVVEETLTVDVGCALPCAAIQSVDVRWTAPGLVPVVVRLVGLQGDAAMELAPAFEGWAGERSGELGSVLAELDGQLEGGHFELRPSFPLKRVGGLDGFALLVEVGGSESLHPLPVIDAYGEVATAPGLLYPVGEALWYRSHPESEPVEVARVAGVDFQRGLERDGTLYAWGPGGLVGVELAASAVATLDPSPRVARVVGERCVLFEDWQLLDTTAGSLREVPSPSLTWDRAALEPDCSRVALLDSKAATVHVVDLGDGTHQSFPVGAKQAFGYYFSLHPSWRAQGLFVSVDDTEVHIGTLAIDPDTGRSKKVPDLPGPSKGQVPPTRVDFGFFVEVEGGVPELVADGNQERWQLTDTRAVQPDLSADCTAIAPKERKVSAQKVPGPPLLLVYTTAMRCFDPYDGSTQELGVNQLVTTSGSKRVVLDSSWKMDPRRWEWSPDGLFVVIDGTAYDAALNVTPPPPGGRSVIWLMPSLESALRAEPEAL